MFFWDFTALFLCSIINVLVAYFFLKRNMFIHWWRNNTLCFKAFCCYKLPFYFLRMLRFYLAKTIGSYFYLCVILVIFIMIRFKLIGPLKIIRTFLFCLLTVCIDFLICRVNWSSNCWKQILFSKHLETLKPWKMTTHPAL